MIIILMWSFFITQLLYRPIFNVLIIFLGIFWWNLGIAIILLTLLIRGIMIKNSMKGANMQKGMANLQPKVEALQKKYENDPQKLSEETLKLFKSEGSNPFKGCLMMLVQIPVFIGLYAIVRYISGESTGSLAEMAWDDLLYSFFRSFGERYLDFENINHTFLWIDLFEKGNWVLTGIVFILNVAQMKLTQIIQPKKPQNQKLPNGQVMPDMSKMLKFMPWFMALMMASIVYVSNSAVGLYLLTTSLFSVCQYSIQYRPVIKTQRKAKFWSKDPIIINPEEGEKA